MQEKKPLLRRIMEGIRPKKLRHDIAPGDKPALPKEEQKRLNEQFLVATREGKIDNIQRLLKAGADIGTRSGTGMTALMWAARNGHTQICKLFLEHGADIEARDNDGWTPLMHAAWGKRTQICKLLLEYNANIEAKSNGGRTALMWAAQYGHTETYMFLKSMEWLAEITENRFMNPFSECVSA
jgi:ankyrin repeat protein